MMTGTGGINNEDFAQADKKGICKGLTRLVPSPVEADDHNVKVELAGNEIADKTVNLAASARLASMLEPKWLTQRENPVAHLYYSAKYNNLRKMAHKLAAASDDCVALSHYSRLAAELKQNINSSSQTISIGVTAPGNGNRQGMTALGLATIWAKWDHNTVLIEFGGRGSELGRTIRKTTPGIMDIIEAIYQNQPLPAPQLLTAKLERLETISDNDRGGYSLARLCESGMLTVFTNILRQRYSRIIWSLPSLDSATWSVAILAEVIDRFVVSACRGKADRRPIERIAGEMSKYNLPPVQLVWHR